MPFGTLNTVGARSAIHLSSPPYTSAVDEFSDVDSLTVRYYTTYDSVKDLVPQELELADEPLVSFHLLRYGFGTPGAYTEFISQVEVQWKGQTCQFSLELMPDNEGVIFAGREGYRIPKIFGRIVWDPSSTSPVPPGYVTGHVEPAGSRLMQFGFRPQKKLSKWGPVYLPQTKSLHLRSTSAPNPTDPPIVQEFIPTINQFKFAEVWLGEGSIGLFNMAEFDPLHRLKVVRYQGAIMMRRASAVLTPPLKRFLLRGSASVKREEMNQ